MLYCLRNSLRARHLWYESGIAGVGRRGRNINLCPHKLQSHYMLYRCAVSCFCVLITRHIKSHQIEFHISYCQRISGDSHHVASVASSRPHKVHIDTGSRSGGGNIIIIMHLNHKFMITSQHYQIPSMPEPPLPADMLARTRTGTGTGAVPRAGPTLFKKRPLAAYHPVQS